MTSSLIQLYHADDNDTGAKIEEFVAALLEYFSLPAEKIHAHTSRKDVEKGIAAISNFISYKFSARDPYSFCPNLPEVIDFVQNGELPDAMIIDMKWLDEQRRPNNSAGEEIIREIVNRNTEVEVFTNTIYGDELLMQITQIAKNYRITAIPGIPSVEDLIKTLPEAFNRIAQKYLRRTSLIEKIKLLELISAVREEDEMLEAVVRVAEREWKVKNLLLCCWNPRTMRYEKLTDTLINIIANLTLAASECFGVFGVKQITHGGNDYFFCSSLEDLKEEIIRQLDGLDSIMNAVKNVAGSNVLPEFYEAHCSTFKSLFLESPLTNNFDARLMNLRDASFRFGSKAQRLNSLGNPQRQEIHLGGHEPSGFLRDGLDEFEINIPVHKIFEEPFTSILSNCHDEFDLYACEIPNLTLNHPNGGVANRNIACYANYLVMRSKLEYKETKLLNKKAIPDQIKTLGEMHFDYFGKYYIAIRKDDSWSFYDCSSINHIHEVDAVDSLFPPRCSLFNQIASDQEYKTYHLFVFHAWRQG